MTDLKVILATALDDQREAAKAEVAADRHQMRLAKSSRHQHELPTLRMEYGAIYQRIIQALLKINFVRKKTPDESLETFCAGKMVEWMDSCERLRDKQSGILFPLTNAVAQEVMSMVTPQQGGVKNALSIRDEKGPAIGEISSRLANLLLSLPRPAGLGDTASTNAESAAFNVPSQLFIVAKEGAIADGDPVVTFTPSGGLVGSVANASELCKASPAPQHAPPAYLVTSKAPLRFDVPSLDDGSYQLAIAHLDTYSLISGNSSHVVVWCKNGASGDAAKAGTLYRKAIPPGCAWFRNFGIVGTGEIRVMVVADGWVRGAGVVVEVTRLFDIAAESTQQHNGGTSPNGADMKASAQELERANTEDNAAEDLSWLENLPAIPGAEAGGAGASALIYDGRAEYDPSIPAAHYLPPPLPPQVVAAPARGLMNEHLYIGKGSIEVAPLGLSLEERIGIIDAFAATLFGRGLGAEAPFPVECPDRDTYVKLHGGPAHPAVKLLDAVTGLPDPTPFGGSDQEDE